jgi:hypothetical protein
MFCSLIHRPWLCKKSSNSVTNQGLGKTASEAENLIVLILWIFYPLSKHRGIQGICVKEAAEPCKSGSSAILLWMGPSGMDGKTPPLHSIALEGFGDVTVWIPKARGDYRRPAA